MKQLYYTRRIALVVDIGDLKKEFTGETELLTKRIEKWAQLIGNKTFLYYGEEEHCISYATFNDMANAIAHNLIIMGIRKGDVVSVFLKNSLIAVLAMYGIWKAGAVYSPINYNFFGKLLTHQINNSKPKLLILETDMISRINDVSDDIPGINILIHRPGKSERSYNPDTAFDNLDGKFTQFKFEEFIKGNTINPNLDIKYYDTANIIYTSGTTGPSKGVVQTHRWINQYTFNPRQLVSQEDVIYNDSPLYHVSGAFANLGLGAWVGCTVAMWDRFSASNFWNRINACGASKAGLIGVMIPRLMKQKETPHDRFNTLKQLHMQPLPENHYEFAKRFGVDFITSGYGQTEAGNGFLGIFDELEEGEGTPYNLYKGHSRGDMLAIAKKYGFPVNKGKIDLPKGYMGKSPTLLQATILNENDEECLPGECGELAFRTLFPYSIFNCYLDNPKATVQSFRNFWFHTGDACKMDEDGNFYFIDRMGAFLRVKGENISSFQIEDIVNSHEMIEMSAVFPIPAEEGGEDEIVLCVVIKDGNYIREKDLTEWIRNNMPRFMWPKYVRVFKDFPRTPTNKVEKYKLKDEVLKQLRRSS